MTTVRSGRLVKSRRSPSKRVKGRVQCITISDERQSQLNVSSSFRPKQNQSPLPRVSPRARDTSDPRTTIAFDNKSSIPSLSRHLVILWKCIANAKSSKKSRRFSYIPDGFTKVDVDVQPEPQTPRPNRRHAGFWEPLNLPSSPSAPELEA